MSITVVLTKHVLNYKDTLKQMATYQHATPDTECDLLECASQNIYIFLLIQA